MLYGGVNWPSFVVDCRLGFSARCGAALFARTCKGPGVENAAQDVAGHERTGVTVTTGSIRNSAKILSRMNFP